MGAAFLNETTYTLVDELKSIAKAHESTVAPVALQKGDKPY